MSRSSRTSASSSATRVRARRRHWHGRPKLGSVGFGHVAAGSRNGKPLILTMHALPPRARLRRAGLSRLVSTIVYNRSQLDELHEEGLPPTPICSAPSVRPSQRELEGFEMVEPDLVYDGEADLDLGGRIVQLRTTVGTHTKGDSWVFLPEGADPLHGRPRREQGGSRSSRTSLRTMYGRER